MKKLISVLFVLSSVTAQAELPPTVESLRRIRAILDSQEVYRVLGSSQWVSSVQEEGNGKYNVVTNECALDVRVEAISEDPPRFVPRLRVTVGQLNCLP